jgi:hypothetical protein
MSGYDSSVGIVLAYGLDDLGSRVRFSAGAEIFLFTTPIQGLFPWGKAAGA